MSVIKDFGAFIKKGNVIDLAVAVVIGGAFGKIVSAAVADLVMPLVNALVPQGDWRKWEVSRLHFRAKVRSGWAIGRIVPRSGQVPTTTSQPTSVSRRTASCRANRPTAMRSTFVWRHFTAGSSNIKVVEIVTAARIIAIVRDLSRRPPHHLLV